MKDDYTELAGDELISYCRKHLKKRIKESGKHAIAAILRISVGSLTKFVYPCNDELERQLTPEKARQLLDTLKDRKVEITPEQRAIAASDPAIVSQYKMLLESAGKEAAEMYLFVVFNPVQQGACIKTEQRKSKKKKVAA